ncbi:hypothetical protein [Streptomyces sp. D54]|uniref:hypothetical protein n=1 Tax=Streptomyces sp. D54 TaxID=1290289 RepID=UPI003CF1E39E
MILDMAHVPSMSDQGLRLLDRLRTCGAEHGIHVVTVGRQTQPLRVLGNRADQLVPPSATPHDAGPDQLLRDLRTRALRAMARGVSSGDNAPPRHRRPPSWKTGLQHPPRKGVPGDSRQAERSFRAGAESGACRIRCAPGPCLCSVRWKDVPGTPFRPSTEQSAGRRSQPVL